MGLSINNGTYQPSGSPIITIVSRATISLGDGQTEDPDFCSSLDGAKVGHDTGKQLDNK